MLKTLIAASLLAAQGCVTTGGDMARIVSEPSGATVVIEGFGECETPCTVELDAPRNVVVAKAGYLARRFQIAPGAGEIKVVLEHAAPTSDVESGELPEL